MSEENKIRDAADAIKGVVEAVPIYQDVAQPALREVGAALQTVSKTVHIALAPISGLVWGYDKIKDFVATSVSKRLEKTPTEQIITPLPQIAGPALEALRYSGHDENLREMFAKLIATSMDKENAPAAHPSFVEIIRQLSSDEAKICRLLKLQSDFAILNLNEQIDETSFRHHIRHFSILGYQASCEFPQMIQRYTDNLCRLGVIGLDFDKYLTENEDYTKIETHHDFLGFMETFKAKGMKPRIERGVGSRTTFGNLFLDACVD